jgi:hypothetical protein
LALQDTLDPSMPSETWYHIYYDLHTLSSHFPSVSTDSFMGERYGYPLVDLSIAEEVPYRQIA